MRSLLGPGRKDESGDFTKAQALTPANVHRVLAFIEAGADQRTTVCNAFDRLVGDDVEGRAGSPNFARSTPRFTAAGYDDTRVVSIRRLSVDLRITPVPSSKPN